MFRRNVLQISAGLGGLTLWLLIAAAALAQDSWTETDAEGHVRVHLYFFWSETCPHCLEAHPFIEAIPVERPWVILHSLEVSRQRDNARRFIELAKSVGQSADAVPALIACGVMETGWDNAAGTGAALLQRLDACRLQAESGTTFATAPASETTKVQIPWLGEVASDRLSLPAFTLMLAGLDAFNPCAFFVLLFLLSLLAHQKNRRRMAIIGGTFVLTSGLMYFAFMAAWLNVFELLGALTGITLTAGLLAIGVGLINIKDFFAFGQGLTLSIPESRKSEIYRRARAILNAEQLPVMLGATLLLAVAANFYELLCTAGFPLVYTRLLTLSDLSPGARYAYLAFYNLIYVLPLALIVWVFVRALGARKLSEREGRLLKLLSGIMMLELGVLLTVAPALLNSLLISVLLLAVALGLTAWAAWLTYQRG